MSTLPPAAGPASPPRGEPSAAPGYRRGRRLSRRRDAPSRLSETDQTGWAVLLACWFSPLAAWGVLLAYALRVQFALNVWPAPGTIPPRALHWFGHHSLCWICLAGATALLLIALAAAALHDWDQRNQRRRGLAFGVGVLALWLTSFVVPPFYGLLLWLIS